MALKKLECSITLIRLFLLLCNLPTKYSNSVCVCVWTNTNARAQECQKVIKIWFVKQTFQLVKINSIKILPLSPLKKIT